MLYRIVLYWNGCLGLCCNILCTIGLNLIELCCFSCIGLVCVGLCCNILWYIELDCIELCCVVRFCIGLACT